MGALALVAFVTALAAGTALDRYGWIRDLRAKLRLLCGVVSLQFVLTTGTAYLLVRFAWPSVLG